MKDALIEQLILIEVRCATSKSSTKNGQTASLTFVWVEDALEDLMIAKAKVRRARPTDDDGIRLVGGHAFSQQVIDRLRLPGRDQSKIEETDRIHSLHGVEFS